ncbi:DUF4349 domain-containing protein [Agromyces aerolatus]|uniref:DUF4349 domain-containing protein n=1 Tax=Agromyces sp. LY-1074 TaxID=3074080 RepID=UPI002855E79E|nr:MULTISPECIES: DUF4349 domain-containing protein [unclassified Agromyces]MDR5699802.1 DUF4349 domain-containing protein [Agromyces sp. LY-1074]MDR5706098.1 DUF4349 domain-containing protein [Agromyces sp. LY-1358]
MSRLPRPRSVRSRHLTRFTAAAGAVAIAALVFAGCTAQPGAHTGTSAPMMPNELATPDGPVEMLPSEVLPGDAASGEMGRDLASGEASDRSVITTGHVAVTVDDPIATAEDVAGLATAAGGRVDNRTETPGTDTQPASAQLMLRVPADQLDAVIEDLRGLGTVTSVSLNASDVTQQRQDLDARIDVLTASIARLTELLAQATSTTDLIAIESELTTRQAELDSLTQQRDWLVDQVDFSTLTVDLATEATAPEARPDDFWGGVVAGWNGLLSFLSGLVVVFGVAVPWIVALAVVAAIVLVVVLLATRGARRRAAKSAPASPDSASAESASPEAASPESAE